MSMWLDARKRGEGWAAMDRGDVDGVRSWLNRMEGEERRKKLDEKDEDGRTMLHWAASRGIGVGGKRERGKGLTRTFR